MIDYVLRLSLRHRVVVLALAVGVAALGVERAREMPIDVLPDISAPRVTIVTEATGLAPTEIEELVTYPIESAVNGVAGTRRVRSASAAGISIVWVEFDWDTTDTTARQRVTERLQAIAGALPDEAEAPLLAPSSSVMGEIAFIALTSDAVDPMELRRVAERDVRRRLLAVEGIAQVVAIGGDVREYQVILDSVRLARFGLTPLEVADALERGSANAPGGFVTRGAEEEIVRVLGRARGVEDLEAVHVVERGGVSVRVRDVADVRVAPAVRRGTGSFGGREAVVLSVVRQPDADTVGTTARLDEALDALEPSLRGRGVTLHRDLFRQVDFIDHALDNAGDALRDGALLVALVLIVFLWRPGATVVSVLALPASILVAVIGLSALGYGLDAMTIGGLAIAVGELVDDAIVDVENVTRRLRERAQQPEAERAPVLETVYEASREIRSSIVSATAILVLVFLPIVFLEGFEGRLLAPLGVAFLVAIAASLLVAITLTPVLASLLLRADRIDAREPPVPRWLAARFAPALDAALRHPVLVAGASALFVAGGVSGLLFAGTSFLPELREGGLNVSMVVLPGTSLAESDGLGHLAEEALLADPGVASVSRRTGRAERDEHVQGPEASELEVLLVSDDPRSREELLEDLRERVSVVPGATFTFGQPISHRIEHLVSGHRTALAIRLQGDDLSALRAAARAVHEAIEPVPGLVDVEVEPIVDVPQLLVDVDADSAARYGLSRGAAAQTIGLALWGRTTGRVFEEGVATDVVVRFGDALREDPRAVRDAILPTPSGATIPIDSIAHVETEPGPNYVMREGVRRRLYVTINVAGRDVGGAADEVREVLAGVALPPGVHAELTGQIEQQERAQARLFVLGALALAGIALIVGLTLRSVRRTLAVLTNLPLALAGGVVGVFLAGGTLSVATTIGFITLFGIATRNGILLATRMADLEAEGVERREAARRAALERLSPIVMTALTAALGLLPLGLALGEPGTEIQAPMALVILTGLVTSTALNMLVVPTLLARWGGDAP
ncbi:MAG: efflux RND transporter permease subunit [Sandaracinaceae bacterium]|nr:efflux RND transporter permease subunit [Sandaracinaceae bacterium]